MNISKECIDMIKKFEGIRLKAYKALPTEEYYTIGIGHYGPDVSKDMVISEARAEELFKSDVQKFERYVDNLGLDLNQNQFDALVSFTYNCGAGNLRKLVAGRTLNEIADAFLLYNKAGGKELNALTRRRKAERELFLKDNLEDGLKISSKVIDIAIAEVGYLEKSRSAYLKNPDIIYEKTAGAGSDNYTKYGKEMHDIYPKVMDFPAYWCDAFVDWCFYKAYGVTTAKSLIGGDFNDYTVASCLMYEKYNALHLIPKVGDQVFFTRNGKPSGCHHTGIVIAVDDTRFYTVEGNTSNASSVVSNGGGVAKKSYKLSAYKGKVIFGRPRYDIDKKTNEEIAVEVIDGKWGNGTARKLNLERAGYNYSEIQQIVNQMLKK